MGRVIWRAEAFKLRLIEQIETGELTAAETPAEERLRTLLLGSAIEVYEERGRLKKAAPDLLIIHSNRPESRESRESR